MPALDEEETIGEVVHSLAGIAGCELIVVDDGSADATTERAERAGARVVRLDRTVGKGRALDAGIARARHDLLVFLDADVVGMDEEKLLSLVGPVREGAAMCVGLRYAAFLQLNRMLRRLPIVAKLSGQRCVERRTWEAARPYCRGYGVESALNYFASRNGEIVYVHLSGLSHRIKEEKRGVVEGLRQRFRMIGDIFVTTLAVRRRPRKNP